MRAECECVHAPGRVAPLQVLERSGRDLVLSCADVIENLMGLVWSKDLKTLRYTTGAVPLRLLSCAVTRLLCSEQSVCAVGCGALCMLRFACCAVHFVRACRPRRNGTGTHKRGLNDGLCGWAGWMGCVMGCVMGCGWRRSPAQSVGGSCRGRAAQKVSRGAGGAQGAQDMQ